MKWAMLGTFIAGMVGLGWLIDQWVDNKYNPEKHHEQKAQR